MNHPGPLSPQSGAVASRRRLHAHVFFTHFPISFFAGAFGFQILHLFMAPACFELATNVALIGGAVMVAPTLLTGWSEWKKHYHGARGWIFRWKIRIAVGLAVLSVLLVVWRMARFGLYAEAHVNPPHLIYLAGNTLLIVGVAFEGFLGGRLTHR